jgi:succinoglycan biosynthesis protein ExoO
MLAAHFCGCVAAAKSRRWADLFRLTLDHPRTLSLLARASAEGIARRLRQALNYHGGAAPAREPRRHVVLISRQRISGANNGSSAYLLDLAKALRRAGFTIDLICPSVLVMGRWPYLRLAPEMQVFERIRIRGCVQIGRYFIFLNVRNVMAAALVATERVLSKIGFRKGILNLKPAPYNVGAPWYFEDLLYLASNVRQAGVLIADYAFQTHALPYALQPEAKTFVVMHELFSRRAEQFEKLGASDSVPSISEAKELAMLDLADVVVAIQREEADYVRTRLPHRPVVTAPMAADPTAAAQPGSRNALLFVGSSAAANVVGLRWFLDNAWPIVKSADATVELWVAGAVSHALNSADPNVRFFGIVSDLSDLYRDCSVVISPLTAGAGLKIKLIEAMGKGKAIVATSKTVEGVEDWVSSAVAIDNSADGFGRHIVALLSDPGLRSERGRHALAIAQKHFSAEACYGEFVVEVEQALRDCPRFKPDSRAAVSKSMQ